MFDGDFWASMGEAQNAQRAGWARMGLQFFGALVGEETETREDLQMMAIDLLADLLHLLGPEEFRAAAAMATMHYMAEIDGSA